MKRAALIALQVGVAVLVGLGVRELWLAHDGTDVAGTEAPDTIAVRTSVTPNVHTFGNPIVATAEVVADAGFIRPETIRLEADFDPYELDGAPTVERDVAGRVAYVVFRFPLRCLREGCDAGGARGVAQLEPGFVRYRFVEGAGPGRQLLEWPPIEVASRVSAAEVEALRWRASDTALPAASFRVGPVALAGVLVALALVLLGAALWLGRKLWRTEPEDTAASDGPTRTPLEQALDLVVAGSSNGSSPSDRRQTLERLARELGSVGQDGLAGDARALAWSPGVASGDEIRGLARRVTDAMGVSAA